MRWYVISCFYPKKENNPMNRNELPDYSVYMIMESCKNNLQPYLDAFMEKCIWMGPSHAPIIRSKKELIAFFESEVPHLTYSVQNLQVIPVPINTTSLNTIFLSCITPMGKPSPSGKGRSFYGWKEKSRMTKAIPKRSMQSGFATFPMKHPMTNGICFIPIISPRWILHNYMRAN